MVNQFQFGKILNEVLYQLPAAQPGWIGPEGIH